jgi:hypothetical protein
MPWSDRIDNSSVNFAVDVNTLAAEIESVENVIGTNPATENNVPTGLPVKYSNVSQRISDANNNNLLPYSFLSTSSFQVPNNTSGSLAQFKSTLDLYSCYNGTDITIPVNGWWAVSSVSNWTWWNDGYSHHMLTLNGSAGIVDESFINWEFPGNIQAVTYSPDGDLIVGNPAELITPRFLEFGTRPVRSSIMWQGALHSGDRLSVYLENGTSNATHTVNTVTLKAFMIRTIPSTVTFASG